MTPERLDEIRTIYRLSRLAAPNAAVTKALEEFVEIAELLISWQGLPQSTHQIQHRSRLLDEQRGQLPGAMRKTSIP